MKIEIIKLSTIVEASKISKSAIYRKIEAGEFPPSVQLGGNSVGFLKHEVDAYMTAMVFNADPKLVVSQLLEARDELLKDCPVAIGSLKPAA